MSMGEDTLNRKIEDGSFTRSDAIRYMQVYIGIVENYKKNFRKCSIFYVTRTTIRYCCRKR